MQCVGRYRTAYRYSINSVVLYDIVVVTSWEPVERNIRDVWCIITLTHIITCTIFFCWYYHARFFLYSPSSIFALAQVCAPLLLIADYCLEGVDTLYSIILNQYTYWYDTYPKRINLFIIQIGRYKNGSVDFSDFSICVTILYQCWTRSMYGCWIAFHFSLVTTIKNRNDKNQIGLVSGRISMNRFFLGSHLSMALLCNEMVQMEE